MIRSLKTCDNIISNKGFKTVIYLKLLSTMTMSRKPSKKLENLKNKEVINHILCEKDELDLGITLKGGQSFR